MTLVRRANSAEMVVNLLNATDDLPLEHRARFLKLLIQLLEAMKKEKGSGQRDHVFVGVAHAVEEYSMSAKLRLEWERPKNDEYHWHEMRLPVEE